MPSPALRTSQQWCLSCFFIRVFFLPSGNMKIFMLFLLNLSPKSIVICSFILNIFHLMSAYFKALLQFLLLSYTPSSLILLLCLWGLAMCYYFNLPSFSVLTFLFDIFIIYTPIYSWVLWTVPFMVVFFSSLNTLNILSLVSWSFSFEL